MAISYSGCTCGAGNGGGGTCECTPECVETVCVLRCDDTNGDGAPDTTYSELWCVKLDGETQLVLTYQDDPAVPYTPVSPVDCQQGSMQCHNQVLCDDSGSFIRRYTFVSDGTAAYVDVKLDGETPHIVTGTVRACDDNPCKGQEAPLATLGLCLADGTPIAVIVTRDCDGAVRQTGWVNLTTGAYSAGAPPVGVSACGESRSVSTSGTFCDVLADGTVAGLVLIEYTYGPDGTVTGVRLVDATTGGTYQPRGTVTACPTGDQQPETDLVVLCDTRPDGTVVPFVRNYRRDETGTITGHSDYTLDGADYQPRGTVGQCRDCRPQAFATECVVEVIEQWTYDNTSGFNGDLSNCGSVTGPGGAQPNFPCGSGTPVYEITSWIVDGRNIVAAPVQFANGPCSDGPDGMHTHWVAALNEIDPAATWELTNTPECGFFVRTLDAPGGISYTAMTVRDAADPSRVWTLGPVHTTLETPYTKVFSRDCDGTVTVTWLDEDGALTPAPTGTLKPCPGTPDTFHGEFVLCDDNGPFVRKLVQDQNGNVTAVLNLTLDGSPHVPTGTVGLCPPTGTPACTVIQAARCDDTTGDGTPDTEYVELLGVDCDGTTKTLGTYTCDLSAAYDPVAPVDCSAGAGLDADPAFGAQPGRIELAPGASWNADSVPTLLSVSATAWDGQGAVSTIDGTTTLRDGERVEFTARRDSDARLTGPLTITATDGTVVVTYTRGVQL